MTTYLLNSAVIAAGAYGTYRYSPASWEELRKVVGGPGPTSWVDHQGKTTLIHTWDELRQAITEPERPISRIGYPETAALIEAVTGWRPPISRETSPLEPGDVAYVVRLRYRVANPARKGEPTGARLEDWELGRLERLS